jgi:hypothetical protein
VVGSTRLRLGKEVVTRVLCPSHLRIRFCRLYASKIDQGITGSRCISEVEGRGRWKGGELKQKVCQANRCQSQLLSMRVKQSQHHTSVSITPYSAHYVKLKGKKEERLWFEVEGVSSRLTLALQPQLPFSGPGKDTPCFPLPLAQVPSRGRMEWKEE